MTEHVQETDVPTLSENSSPRSEKLVEVAAEQSFAGLSAFLGTSND